MHPHLLHNREIRQVADRVLSAGQVGFLNGWGVFSTLRVTEGVLFAFERHYARLERDARLLHVPFTISQAGLRQALLSLVEANGAYDAVLRVALVRNKGGLFEAGDFGQSDLIAFTANLTHWPEDVHLGYVANARYGASPFAGAKLTSWAQNLAWHEQAHDNGFDEALLLNEHGQISECTSANIFAVRGRNVYTPPLSTSGCLPGITRAILLDELRYGDVSVAERELSPSELEDSDCVFITSTTRDLLPVRAIDNYALRQKRDVFDMLKNSLTAYRDKYVARTSLPNPLLLAEPRPSGSGSISLSCNEK